MEDKELRTPFQMAAIEQIKQADKIVIICHMGPDLDALGSLMAMAEISRQIGGDVKEIRMVVGGHRPVEDETLFNEIETYRRIIFTGDEDATEYFTDALSPDDPDLLILVDAAVMSRFTTNPEFITALEQDGMKTMRIDHHPSEPREYFDIVRATNIARSTTELIYFTWWLFAHEELGIELTPDLAKAIMIGIWGDTGFYKYSMEQPELQERINDVVNTLEQETGLSFTELYQDLLILPKELGDCISNLQERRVREVLDNGMRIIGSYVDDDEVAKYSKSEQDALKDRFFWGLPRGDNDIEVFIRRYPDGKARLSLRRGGLHAGIGKLTRMFGGGGHDFAGAADILSIDPELEPDKANKLPVNAWGKSSEEVLQEVFDYIGTVDPNLILV